MEVLKSVWRSPVAFRKKQKHKRVPEDQWGKAEEPIIDGVGFHLKYIGSTLVDEIPDGHSYGEGVSSDAVKTIVVMAKSKGNKLDKASLKISSSGIEVIDLTQNYTISKVSIDRICFCTADKHYDKVFAFILRNTENETMECHAFHCDNRKMAHAVTMTVARAFSVARDHEKQSACNQKSDDSCSGTDSPVFDPVNSKVNGCSLPTSDVSECSPSSSVTSSPLPHSSSRSSPVIRQTSPNTTQPQSQPKTYDKNQIEEDFNLEDSFSQLAQMRVHSNEQSF